MARSKLTEELCENICKDIREGGTLKYSAMHNGITPRTLHNWMSRGENAKTENGLYFHFFHQVKKAQEDGKVRLIGKIEKHGERNWQALAWLLERMYPDEFGRTQRVDMRADVKSDVKTTSRDKTLDLDVKSLTAEERVELGRLITKIRRGTDSGDVGGEG